MPNDSRNNYEPPCYLDVGQRLFPEAPAGQRLDLSDPQTRDQMLKKHVIRETERIGMQPVMVWLFSHRDVSVGETGVPSSASHTGRNPTEPEDFYGDGGDVAPDIQREVFPKNDPHGDAANFYNEMPEKVYSGPFNIHAEYLPNQSEHILTEMGVDRPVNDIFSFLIDDAIRVMGRVPEAGDIIRRFDGKMMEVLTSRPLQAENFEWLYQQCTAVNTQKDLRQFFRE